MGKGKMSGSPFHIENIGDLARGSVNSRIYNPPPQQKIECPHLYVNRCTKSSDQPFCTYWKCTTYLDTQAKVQFETTTSDTPKRPNDDKPKSYSFAEKIEIADECIRMTQSSFVRALITAYINGNQAPLDAQNLSNPERYKEALTDLYEKAKDYAKAIFNYDTKLASSLDTTMFQVWKAYLALFSNESAQIKVAHLDSYALLQAITLGNGSGRTFCSFATFAKRVEFIAAERLLKVDNASAPSNN